MWENGLERNSAQLGWQRLLLRNNLRAPDLGAIARAYGARGTLARTIEEVRKGVQEWVAKPGPMIIDSRISKAVINLPMRRLLYGKDE